MKSIIITSIVFAGALYSQTQNVTNTQIVQLSALKDTTVTPLDDQPFGARPNPYLKKSIRMGEIVFDGMKYKCALYYFIKRHNYYSSHLWIDTRANGTFDFFDDFLEEVRHPFTLFGKSYDITQLDSLGYSFTMSECNQQEIPPIQVGLRAPNIEFTSIDKKNLDLYSFNNNIKVLFFWTCDVEFHANRMRQVVDHFRGKEIVFINSSLEPFGLEKESYPWIHFYCSPYGEQRTILQIGSQEKMLVIDKNNKILSIGWYYPQVKDIIEEIEKVISM